MRIISLIPWALWLSACAITPDTASSGSTGGVAPVTASDAGKAAPEGSSVAQGSAQGSAKASDGGTLGDPLPADMTPVHVKDLAQKAADFNGKRIMIEGVVTKLCKKKGCWFELTDGAGSPSVLVTGSRYHIFLNQGMEGKTATAFGEFKREVQDLAEAKHLAQDAGEPEPTEAPVVLRLVADGVALR